MRGTIIRGGEDNDIHRSSSSFVFHRNDEGQHKKRNKNNSSMSFSSCLKGVRAGGGGKDNDD
jgi:hypothetical protein